jgi:hypothetical protein
VVAEVFVRKIRAGFFRTREFAVLYLCGTKVPHGSLTQRSNAMSGFFNLIAMFMLCGTVLGVMFMWALNSPEGKLRDLVLHAGGWAMALFCAAYAICPLDIAPEALLGPFGLVDDFGAVIAGIVAAREAWGAGNRRKAEKRAAA